MTQISHISTNNFFNETVEKTEEKNELFHFIKKNFQFCEVIFDTDYNVGLSYDNTDSEYYAYSGMMRFIISVLNGVYEITDFMDYEIYKYDTLLAVRDKLVRRIGKFRYDQEVIKFRQTKLERILK